MPAAPVGELPTETLPTVELPNPVIPSDMEFSKSNFNAAMEAEKENPSQPTEPTETPPPSKPESPEPEQKTEETPVVETTTSDKTDTPPATKSSLPEELLTGKKPEPKVDDAIAELDAMVLPKNAKPEQVASFAKLKEQAKKVIEEKVGRINELESKTSEGASRHEIEAAHERIKAAEAKALEFEQTIERLAFTESPRFKQFLNDETATLTNAKSYFEGTEINPDIVEYAARASGAQRIRILTEAGADPNLIGAVSPYLAEYDKIQRYKTGALENWKAEQSKWVEQTNAQRQAADEQRKMQEDQIWESVASRLKTEVAAFRKFDGNEDWNKQADNGLAEWKRIYNGESVDLESLSETIGYGIAYKVEHKINEALREQNKNLANENARLKSAKPGASNGQGSASATDLSRLTPTQQAMARFNAEKARAAG
jgi:hypothetical protein